MLRLTQHFLLSEQLMSQNITGVADSPVLFNTKEIKNMDN